MYLSLEVQALFSFMRNPCVQRQRPAIRFYRVSGWSTTVSELTLCWEVESTRFKMMLLLIPVVCTCNYKRPVINIMNRYDVPWFALYFFATMWYSVFVLNYTRVNVLWHIYRHVDGLAPPNRQHGCYPDAPLTGEPGQWWRLWSFGGGRDADEQLPVHVASMTFP